MSSQEQSPLTLCKTFLRHDQKNSLYNKCIDSNVKIFAPKWVEEALAQIWPGMKGAVVEVYGKRGPLLDSQTLTDKITLRDLQILSRNEPRNTSGIINLANYTPTNGPLILTLKDLVRQCIIIGSDETTHYGGFPRSFNRVPQKAKVYICDLTGLQFKHEYNSGRLVLIGIENSMHSGELDDFIYEKVVGEKKKTLEEVKNIESERYVSTHFKPQTREIYFDTLAYKRFVANDVVLCGIALDSFVEDNCNQKRKNKDTAGPTEEDEKVVLKFLKYGSGFFAGSFRSIIDEHVLAAVVDGLEHLFRIREIKHIKAVEFPFYKSDPKEVRRLEAMKKKYAIEYQFSNEDALKTTWPGYITATTNCADPHAATGNEMGHSSVDSAIASNLSGKGNKFSPLLNPEMGMQFVDFQLIAQAMKELSAISSM